MGFIGPTNVELLAYGVEGWNRIIDANFRRLNSLFASFQGAWHSPPSRSLLRFVDGEWKGDSSHEQDQTAHNLTARTQDIVFSDPSKGIVLIDRATGGKYRIYVEGSEVKIEKIT